MLYKKTGFPEENELVICTVTKVHYNSVFAKLDEYDKSGMIHISEVSPGRIRNIRDYVKEGKRVVCKVLRINEERGHIDLSLRRVSEMQKREKTNWLKQEQKAEKIIEQVAKKLNKNFEELYNEIRGLIFKKYDSLNSCFEEFVAGELSLKDIGVAPKIAAELEALVKARIKTPKVKIKGYFKLTSYESNGVEVVKEGLKKAEISEDVKIRYLGAGRYGVEVTAPDYKKAEKILEKATKETLDFIEKNKGEGKFIRVEK